MLHLARLAEKLDKDPSLKERFENLKCVWGGTFRKKLRFAPLFTCFLQAGHNRLQLRFGQ